MGKYILGKRNFDLIDFHAYSVANNRISCRKTERFDTLLETGILMRLKEVFESWHGYTNSIIRFKN